MTNAHKSCLSYVHAVHIPASMHTGVTRVNYCCAQYCATRTLRHDTYSSTPKTMGCHTVLALCMPLSRRSGGRTAPLGAEALQLLQDQSHTKAAPATKLCSALVYPRHIQHATKHIRTLHYLHSTCPFVAGVAGVLRPLGQCHGSKTKHIQRQPQQSNCAQHHCVIATFNTMDRTRSHTTICTLYGP